jgi:hypothetical protein
MGGQSKQKPQNNKKLVQKLVKIDQINELPHWKLILPQTAIFKGKVFWKEQFRVEQITD